MKKIIKKLNNSVGLTFNKEERKIYDLNIDDVIDIEITREE